MIKASFSRSTVIQAFIFLLVASPLILFQAPGLIGAESTYVVESGSMEPTIDTGSAIWVYGIDEVREGDIITFRTGVETRTTHRVVDIEESGGETRYVTKGDANDDADTETVARENVEGRVRFSIPYLGAFLSAITSRMAFGFMVLIPAFVLVANESTKIYREIKQHHVEDEHEKAYNSLLVSISLIMPLTVFTTFLLMYPLNLLSAMMAVQVIIAGLALTGLCFAAIFWYYEK